jgi:predicted ATPase/transcriptional regulator with XRE-family HTH domain
LSEVPFGEWLKRQRNIRGLTQEQLAHQIGCAAITLRKIEGEQRRPSIQIIELLAGTFAIPANERKRFMRYARGESNQTPEESPEDSPWQTTISTRTNLPAPLTALIGREPALADIGTYLRQKEIRLVTLIGPPGIGKTRLSVEVARQLLGEFAGGTFFVALAPLDDPSLIAPTFLQALGYVESKKLPVEKQLIRSIAEKHMLIVLDNCEHLIQNVATLTSGILSACSRLKMLATSREALRIPGEWLYEVPALTLPREGSSIDSDSALQYSALTLFSERARAARRDFVLTADNSKTVAAICTRLDGLPLAIELIAAQMRSFSTKPLLERLNDRVILSANGGRTAPTRHISLSHAIGWSYDLLPLAEQKLFAYLSVFSGGITMPAAESVFSKHFAGKPVSELLTSLLEKSLLQRSTDSQGETRFTMLVTVRHFALERLRHLGEEAEIRSSHLDYFLDFAERVNRAIHGPNQLEWINRAESELDNVRASINWTLQSKNAEAGLRLANRLSFWCIVRGYLRDGIGWLEHALAQSQGVSKSSRAAALSNLSGMISMGNEGYHREATSLLTESLRLHQELEDDAGIARALNLLGLVVLDEGDYEEAEQLFSRSLAIRRELGDPWSIANTLQNFIGLALIRDDYAGARRFAEETLALFRQAGDQRGIGRELMDLGQIARLEGSLKDATTMLTRALSQLWQIKDQWSLASALENLAGLAYAQRDPERSARLFGVAENLRELIGTPLQTYDRAFYEKHGQPDRKAMRETALTTAWAEGRAMTLEQAISYALENQSGNAPTPDQRLVS